MGKIFIQETDGGLKTAVGMAQLINQCGFSPLGCRVIFFIFIYYYYFF